MQQGMIAEISTDCLAWQGVVCGQCAAACGHRAIGFHAGYGYVLPRVDSELCHGCGACLAACRQGTIRLVPRVSPAGSTLPASTTGGR